MTPAEMMSVAAEIERHCALSYGTTSEKVAFILKRIENVHDLAIDRAIYELHRFGASAIGTLKIGNGSENGNSALRDRGK